LTESEHTGDSNGVYTVKNQVFDFWESVKKLLWFFEAQMTPENKVALESPNTKRSTHHAQDSWGLELRLPVCYHYAWSGPKVGTLAQLALNCARSRNGDGFRNLLMQPPHPFVLLPSEESRI
jgi:hypothetical protein